MELLRNAPIKRKLLLSTLATCGAALALALSGLFWFQSVNFRSNFAAQLRTLAAVVAQNSAAPLVFEDEKSALDVLSVLQANAQIAGVSIYDGEGKLFAQYGAAPENRAAEQISSFDRWCSREIMRTSRFRLWYRTPSQVGCSSARVTRIARSCHCTPS